MAKIKGTVLFENRPRDLRMIAWEVTRRCNLACRHCRASSQRAPYANELATAECFKLIDEIASFSSPVIILTGGEPLLREDIFEIAGYGKKKGLRMVMATNGTLLTAENTAKIMQAGIQRISVSLDGPDAATHDDLRQVPGAFKRACEGIARARKTGLEFQINSTITKRNLKLLPRMMELAKELGAKAQHIFLLVPTGRAKDMAGEELSASEYEETLKALAQEKNKSSLEIKITCAPHLNRILAQEHLEPAASLTGRGCMAGVSFCFIAHTGDLQPCGYLDLKCGNVREQGFKQSWFESEVFNNLRDFSKYKGKCGICEFRAVCSGCRARAYAVSKDYLEEEPYCVYKPKAKK